MGEMIYPRELRFNGVFRSSLLAPRKDSYERLSPTMPHPLLRNGFRSAWETFIL